MGPKYNPPVPFVFLSALSITPASALSRPHQVPKVGRDKGFWEDFASPQRDLIPSTPFCSPHPDTCY